MNKAPGWGFGMGEKPIISTKGIRPRFPFWEKVAILARTKKVATSQPNYERRPEE